MTGERRRASVEGLALYERIVVLHRALDQHGLPHAFGGALALAWCTQQARGTLDLDVNVFVGVDEVDRLLAALPQGVVWTDVQRAVLVRDGQVRLWWDATPVDVFLNTTEFHVALARRVEVERLGDEAVPFLGCSDLAVFKAFFNRSKDWVDLEEMVAAGTLDGDRVLGVLVRYLGGSDERVERLRRLIDPA